MSSTITVHDIDAGDKAWLKYEARRLGVSIVTRNARHFHNTGASVVDPWTGVRR